MSMINPPIGDLLAKVDCRYTLAVEASKRARQLIDEGRLGRIISFRGEYLHTSAIFADKPIGWKQNRDVCGGGVLSSAGTNARRRALASALMPKQNWHPKGCQFALFCALRDHPTTT